MKKLLMGIFAFCLGLGMISCGNKTVSNNEGEKVAEKKITPQEVIAKAKAEGANWDKAQWKAAMKDMMKAVSPLFDYMRDMEKQMKEAENGDDAAKVAAVAKIMSDAESKKKEFEPLEKALNEFEKIMEGSEIGKKVNEDKAFQEEIKKEFNLPEDM